MTTQALSRERRDWLVAKREELQLGCGFENQRSLPYFSPRPRCPDGDLCRNCEYAVHLMVWPISVDEVREEDEEERDLVPWICLGFVDRMLATAYCPFCQFLLKMFFDDCPGFPSTEVVCETNRRRFCCWLNGADHAELGGFSGRRPLDQLDWKYTVSFQEVSDFDRERGTFSPYNSAFGGMSFSLDIVSRDLATRLYGEYNEKAAILNVAREIPQFWNSGMFREALKMCLDRHGQRCDRAVAALSRYDSQFNSAVIPVVTERVRIVDVQEMRICYLPAETQYAALSYCWTKEAYTTLTKQNLAILQEPFSLTGQDLPPTITDVITVTQELGLRFVWIDRICIIQDDTKDKLAQLAQMDNIYRGACITIVSAASTDGIIDIGLPGVRTTHPRLTLNRINVRGLWLQQNPSNIWHSLERSRWHSRAWTFQEYLLSKRLLIFMPEQASFYCEQAHFTESYVDHVCMGARGIQDQLLAPCCNLTITENLVDGKEVDAPRNYNNTYEDMVNAYTKREITYQSDSLNAFHGLLNLLSREHRVRFLCGLPVPHLFGRFLLWCPTKYSIRREISTGGSSFPSWSWAGWQGEAVYPSLSWPMQPQDDGFTVEGIKVHVHSEVSGWRLVLSSQHNSEYHDPDEPEKALLDIQWCMLAFNTDVGTSFSVQKNPYGMPCYLLNPVPDSLSYPIMLDGKHAGSLLLHHSKDITPEVFRPEFPVDDLGFIALSRAQNRWTMWYPIVPDKPLDEENYYYETEDPYMFVDRPPFDEHQWDILGLIVNVMLVQWKDGIAYRLGMGQIHADAWDSSTLERKDIILG